jgi:hypothetical protein
MSNWPKQSECNNFYGNPDPRSDGVPSRMWEDENLTRIKPPWRMVLAWDKSNAVSSIRIHKKCAESLSRVLSIIWKNYGEHQTNIEAGGLHLYGGAYNFRMKRGGSTLSMHSYGCAIDLDPEHNGFGAKRGAMPLAAITAFQAEGWVYGGLWRKPDWMHFQAAIV